DPSYVTLLIPASKTDPFRKGIKIYIAAAPGQHTSLAAAGIDPSPFAGHSFRRGAASAAAAAGFADHEIQLLGRWHSDCFKLYIE
ncbi:hypothetical protein SCHPADRAFT_788685, partial [Schizopora paradoxa]